MPIPTFCKTALAAAILATAAMHSAHADIVTFVGDTANNGGATYNRPVEDFSGLSTVGTAVRYLAYKVDITQANSEFNFLTSCSFDCFTFLYETTFNAGDPLQYALVGNDDLTSFTTSGFSTQLAPGLNYVLVVTGFENMDYGDFSTTISGPGGISVSAVPEPATYLMLGAGLLGLGLMRRRRPD